MHGRGEDWDGVRRAVKSGNSAFVTFSNPEGCGLLIVGFPFSDMIALRTALESAGAEVPKYELPQRPF